MGDMGVRGVRGLYRAGWVLRDDGMVYDCIIIL